MSEPNSEINQLIRAAAGTTVAIQPNGTGAEDDQPTRRYVSADAGAGRDVQLEATGDTNAAMNRLIRDARRG